VAAVGRVTFPPPFLATLRNRLADPHRYLGGLLCRLGYLESGVVG
jgi:hypothetical protein